MKKANPKSLYLFTMLIAGVSNRIVFTTSILYRIQEVGLDPLQLVLVGTTLEATALLFEIPTGVLADVYSRRLSVIIGMFLVGLGFMIEGFAPLFAFVLIAQVCWGIGITFLSGAHSAWIADEVGVDAVGPIYLRSRQTNMLGSLIGIPISIWLANYSLALPFLIGGGIRVVYSIILLFVMQETGFKPAPKGEREGWRSMISTTRQGFKFVKDNSLLMIYVLIGLVVGLYSEGWDRLSEAFLIDSFSFPSFGSLNLTAVEWLGILSFSGILIGLIATEWVKRKMDTQNSLKLTKGLQKIYFVMIGSLMAFALSRNFWLAVATMLLFDVMRGLTFPLTTTWLNQQIDSSVRATVLSMSSQLDAVGQFTGGPLVGWIGKIRSVRAAIFSAGILLSPTVFLFGRVKKEIRKESVSQD